MLAHPSGPWPRLRAGLFLCLAAGFTPASQLKLSAGLLSEALGAAVPGPAFYHTGKRCARDDARRWSKGRQSVVCPPKRMFGAK
jgi:hypothetical protein